MSNQHGHADPAHRRSLLRGPAHDGHQPVGYAELFFDLVYVFAITQLSHYLLGHDNFMGIVQGTILFVAVWWAWIYMAWATNWVDPERGAVRAMIFINMLIGLVMAASIPEAFGGRAWSFVIAYLLMQVGRTSWLVWVVRAERPVLARSLTRGVIWFLFAAPFWIAGAILGAEARLWCWAAALAIELVAPALLYPVPGLRHSETEDFGVTGGHMAERCGLFIIMSLGEGILLTGATFAQSAWTDWTIGAFLAAFCGSIAMWWIYFDIGARRGSDLIARHHDSGRIARDAYTYWHIPIVAGVVMTAASDELVLAHPHGHISSLLLWAGSGGTAIFLFGVMYFKRATSGRPWFPVSHMAGLGMVAAVAAAAYFGHIEPVHLSLGNAAVLIIVAAWEWGSLNGGWVERGVRVPQRLVDRADRKQAEMDARVAADLARHRERHGG